MLTRRRSAVTPGRLYEVRTGAALWRLDFAAYTDFEKPWPLERGITGTGSSRILRSGRQITADDLRIRSDEDAARIMAVAGGVEFPCNGTWLERNLRLLAGQLRPLRMSGFYISPLPRERSAADPSERLRDSLFSSLDEFRRSPGYQSRPVDGVVTSKDPGPSCWRWWPQSQ